MLSDRELRFFTEEELSEYKKLYEDIRKDHARIIKESGDEKNHSLTAQAMICMINEQIINDMVKLGHRKVTPDVILTGILCNEDEFLKQIKFSTHDEDFINTIFFGGDDDDD